MKTGAHPEMDTRNLQPVATLAETTFRAKFEALLPRLASDHDGEVIATARALDRVLKRAGMDWHDIVKAVQFPDVIEDEPTDLLGMAEWLHHHAMDRLFGTNQPAFVQNVIVALKARRTISPGQQKYLRDLFAMHHGRRAEQ